MSRIVPLLGAILIGTAILTGSVTAEDDTKASITVGAKQAPITVGAKAVTAGRMYVRATAPTDVAAWYSKARLVGIIDRNKLIQIIDAKALPSLVGKQTWVKFKVLDEDVSPKTGWIYYGGPEYLTAASVERTHNKDKDQK